MDEADCAQVYSEVLFKAALKNFEIEKSPLNPPFAKGGNKGDL